MKNKEISLNINREELSKCACFNFRKAARVITQIYDDKLRSCGLRVTQLSILFVTAAVESATITHLAETLVMERTTLTRNLKPLEKGGFLRIDPGKDLRTRIVTLTEQGQQLIIKALPLWEEAQHYVTEQLGQDRWTEMLGHLSATISLERQK